MPEQIFQTHNYVMPTTAAAVPVTTGTAIKTMLQLLTPATTEIDIIAWGISFDGAAAAAGIVCELIDTGAVAATVTAHVAAGIIKYSSPAGVASQLTLSTTGTGYTASAEGTITATRTADVQVVQPTNQYVYEWALGREFHVPVSTILRVRVKAAAAVNALCWIRWKE